MSFKNRLGVILVVLGFISIPFVRFGEEFLLLSAFLLAFGAVRISRELGVKNRLGNLMGSMRRPVETQAKSPPKIDPLLPVRVLKLAESRSGVITVSTVAMALNVGLDECQLALDDLVRKGAANVDVDLSNGVASYSFPEFLPHSIEDAGST
ncbi:MAG: hypothetical protein ABSF43_00240 [Rectinemataceae bacterium]|jgi:hypothetical protein